MANAKKLKIGFVFDDTLDSYDGVAQYVKTLGAWLGRQGHEVCYLVGQTKMKTWAGGRVYSLAKNKKVTFNGNQARIPLPANKKNIKQVLADESFDVLHVQVPYSPFLAQKIINAAGANVAVVGTFHVAPGSIFSKWGGHFLRFSYGRSLKRFDQIVSVSTAAADYAKASFSIKTEILPNVIDYDRFRQKSQTRPGLVKNKVFFSKNNKILPTFLQGRALFGSSTSADILFFGRLVKRKGAKELIEAFSALRKSNKTARLIIAGDGPERKYLENLTKKLGLNDSVEFLGFIKENDKPGLLTSADVVCFPSLGGESFGIVLLEAMASGSRIVIGGDNPGYKTVLGAHPELLFDPKNAPEFARKLDAMLLHNDQTKKLHDWQQNEVKKYDVKTVGPSLIDIYKRAIDKHKQNGHN